MPWQPVLDLNLVQVGDVLRVDGGTPFEVRAVVGWYAFSLELFTDRGLPLRLNAGEQAERFLPEDMAPDP